MLQHLLNVSGFGAEGGTGRVERSAEWVGWSGRVEREWQSGDSEWGGWSEEGDLQVRDRE